MKLLSGLILTAALVFGQATADVDLKAAMHKEQVQGDLKGAIESYRKIIAKHAQNRALVAQAMLQMAGCHEKLGESEARKIYEQLVKNYSDQAAVARQARAKLAGAAAADGGMRMRHSAQAGPGCMPQVLGARLTDCHRAEGIFVRDLQTGEERLVVQGSRTQGRLGPGAFSPDEKTLTYFDSASGLRAVGTDGSGDRPLGRVLLGFGGIPLLYGLWTRDGKHLMAIMPVDGAGNTGVELALIALADGKKQSLRRLEAGPYAGAILSPDEKFVAVTRGPDRPGGEIVMLPRDGGEAMPLGGTGPVQRLVGWHASGRLLYTSDRSGGSVGIWAIQVEQGKAAGEPELVHKGIHPTIRPWLGRDGAIHYEEWGGPNLVQTATLDAAAGTLSAPKPATKLFASGNWTPDYSPDGRTLVYATAYAPATVKFVVQDLAGGKETAYQAPFRTVMNSIWYPDGSALLVHAIMDRGDAPSLYRFVPATGETKLLAKEATGAFSRDGQHLYFTPRGDKPGVVRRMNLNTGDIREISLPGNPEGLRQIDVAADGARISFEHVVGSAAGPDRLAGNVRLVVASLPGGPERVLFESPRAKMRGMVSMAWAGDGKALLYGLPKNEGGYDLWMVAAEGGQPRKVYSGSGDLDRIAVHPNGRDVAMATRDRTGGRFWVIENAFGGRRR